MKLIPTVLAFLLTLCAFAQDNVRLIINPHGHTSIISGVALTPDEKLLVSVSHDKSVKIWSTEYGNLVGEIHGERGEGSIGQLYCVAISPDGKYLATAGYLMEQKENSAWGLIRIYDFKKRKLIKVLKGHTNVIHSLAFSPGGKYLASAGADGHVLVWNVNDFSLYHDFAAHTKTARTVCFMSDDKMVSGGWDAKINKYDLPSKKIEKTTGKDEYPVNEICFNPDLKKLFVAYNEYSKVQVMGNELEVRQEIEIWKPISTIYSKGDKLIVGQERKPYMSSIYQYMDGEFKVTNGFNGMTNTVTCSGLITSKNIAYSVGGRDNEIVFWTYQEADKEGMVNFGKEGVHLTGYGMAFCAVGFAENMVAFTQGDCDDMFGEGTLKVLFDLQNGGLYKLNKEEESAFRGIYKTKGNQSLKHRAGGILNYPDAILGYSENNKEIWSVTFDETSGYACNAYSFAGTDWIVTGNKPDIYIFNKQGVQTAILHGHESEIRALWSDKDGKYLISAGLDQTIRIWNISTIKNEKSIMKYEQLYPSSIKFFKEKYPTLDFTTPAGMKKLYENVDHDFGEDTSKYLVAPTVITPEANIFIGWNNEWIIWTNDGYFKGSKEGSKYIGYHLNMGQEKDAKYYPFDQFDLKYNRPDIINQRLGIGDSLYNESLKKAHERRLKKMGLDENDLTENKNLPEVQIISQAENTNELVYKLEMTATTTGADLYKIKIYNNGVPVLGTKGYTVEVKDKRALKKMFDVPLVTGENNIQVSAVNKEGAESLMETVTILCTDNKTKGNLYLVTIGVSEYSTSGFNLKYAAKDAGDVEAQFRQAKIYANVFSKTFVNAEVSKAMLPKIKEFLAQANPNDQVVVFIAGHGVLNKDFEYYFASHDMDFEKPESKGISYAEIENLLDEIKSLKKVLFMDTCHSGEVDKDDVEQDNKSLALANDISFRAVGANVKHKSLGMAQTTELMKEVFNDMRKGTGSNIVSSAGGYELAMESKEWNNGLFTYVLLDGIKSMQADLNKDGEIMISELKQWSGYKVAELSKGLQVPANRNENISFDYRIW
jgi:WD40 repeat protein